MGASRIPADERSTKAPYRHLRAGLYHTVRAETMGCSDGYMSRDAWSSGRPVFQLQYSNTDFPPARSKKTKTRTSQLCVDSPPSRLIRGPCDHTMPISPSQTGTIKSKSNVLGLDHQQEALQETFEALSIDPSPSNNISTNETTSYFLALPAELRIAIYTAILLDPSNNNLNLLLTSQQIHMEATPILYQRPISFPSQSALLAWITRSSLVDLARVRTLTLRLTDVDFSPLLQTPPSASNRSAPRPTAWSLYQHELESLDKALQSLPNLAELTIKPPERSNSQLLRGMYLSFLALIPERLQRLRRLTIHDSESVREKVPNLRKLSGTAVVFDEAKSPGSSSSSASSSVGNMYGSFSDVVKAAQSSSSTTKVKVEEDGGGMEGVWYQRL